MRRKFRKRLALFCVVVTALVTMFSSSTLIYGAPKDTSFYKDVTKISDKSTILTRGNYLNYGAVTMTALDSMKIRISGETAAHIVCDTLEVSFVVSRSKDGKNYEYYRQWTFQKKNGSYFWKVLEVIVPNGYYYAISGIHTAVYKGDAEMTGTYAEGLWVN